MLWLFPLPNQDANSQYTQKLTRVIILNIINLLKVSDKNYYSYYYK